MSHFPSMFKSSAGMSSFLIHIGRFRECAIYSFSNEGNVNEFVAGRLEETLGVPLKLAGYQLMRCNVCDLSGFQFESWKDWCVKLNEQDVIALALYDAVDPGDFISHDAEANVYQVTPKGLAQDEE